MSLLPTNREFLALVERETGYPVKVLEDPNLPTLTTIRRAGGTVPTQFLTYRPTHDESLDYMICYQCGFVLRLFESPPGQHFVFAGAPDGSDSIPVETDGVARGAAFAYAADLVVIGDIRAQVWVRGNDLVERLRFPVRR